MTPLRVPDATPSARSTQPVAALFVLVLALAFSAVGCPCVRGAVNASPSLRWWLFSNFGASRICPEMLKTGMPLKVAALGPNSVGRFFPATCATQVDEQQKTIAVTLSGTGYANFPVTRRVGFSVQLSVEYAPDFYLADNDVTYVWGKFSRLLNVPDFRIVGVENPVINLATQTPAGSVANMLAQSVVSSEVGRGFTVVRQPDGDDFALGYLAPPQKPARLFAQGSDRIRLASDTISVHSNAREFLGPFEVPTQGKALFLRLRTQGAPLKWTVVDRASGDAWRRAYEAALPMGPPFAAPISEGQIPMGESQQMFPLAQGQYFVVLENRSTTLISHLGLGVGDPTAETAYSVELGERP